MQETYQDIQAVEVLQPVIFKEIKPYGWQNITFPPVNKLPDRQFLPVVWKCRQEGALRGHIKKNVGPNAHWQR